MRVFASRAWLARILGGCCSLLLLSSTLMAGQPDPFAGKHESEPKTL